MVAGLPKKPQLLRQSFGSGEACCSHECCSIIFVFLLFVCGNPETVTEGEILLEATNCQRCTGQSQAPRLRFRNFNWTIHFGERELAEISGTTGVEFRFV